MAPACAHPEEGPSRPVVPLRSVHTNLHTYPGDRRPGPKRRAFGRCKGTGDAQKKGGPVVADSCPRAGETASPPGPACIPRTPGPVQSPGEVPRARNPPPRPGNLVREGGLNPRRPPGRPRVTARPIAWPLRVMGALAREVAGGPLGLRIPLARLRKGPSSAPLGLRGPAVPNAATGASRRRVVPANGQVSVRVAQPHRGCATGLPT